jgi:fimbrial chaperone protein
MNPIVRICCATALLLCASVPAFSAVRAQGIDVSPVNVQLAPGQLATTLTVTNRNSRRMSFQIRGFAWEVDAAGNDVVTPTDALLSSPPIATVQAGASQVVRLVLKKPPGDRESTYRIVFDQLPAPNDPGVVRVLIRISIPVFAEPDTRVDAHLNWRIAHEAGRWWLIVSNTGNRHLSLADLKLEGPGGQELPLDVTAPPHILAGATRRWAIQTTAALPANAQFRVTASADVGVVDQRVSIDAGP